MEVCGRTIRALARAEEACERGAQLPGEDAVGRTGLDRQLDRYGDCRGDLEVMAEAPDTVLDALREFVASECVTPKAATSTR